MPIQPSNLKPATCVFPEMVDGAMFTCPQCNTCWMAMTVEGLFSWWASGNKPQYCTKPPVAS